MTGSQFRIVQFLITAALVLGATPAATEDPQARVATLLPFVGDAFGALAGKSPVVATARASLHAPAPEGLIDLGNPHSPNLEALALARPDLVVADRGIHARFEKPLQHGGAKVVWFDTGSVDATLDGLVALATEVGRGPEMVDQVDAVRSALGGHRLAIEVPVLALFGTPSGFFVMSERVWLGDLLNRLGFDLLKMGGGVEESLPGLVPVSDEHLVSLRPELILLVAHGDPRALQQNLRMKLEGGAWSALGAAATRGVEILDARRFSANPGLAMDSAAAELVALGRTQPRQPVAAP